METIDEAKRLLLSCRFIFEEFKIDFRNGIFLHGIDQGEVEGNEIKNQLIADINDFLYYGGSKNGK